MSFSYNIMQNPIKESFISTSNNNNILINNDMEIRNHNSMTENKNNNSGSISSFNEDSYKKEEDKIFILTKNFHFFNDFILSPNTFISFYLLLFNNQINNKEIFKAIKNYNLIKNNDELNLYFI